MKTSHLAVVLLLCTTGTFPLYANPPSPQISLPVISQKQEQKININTADVATMAHSFKGIGQKRAEAIVLYREAHGGFKSVSELAQIHGLGLGFVTRYQPQLEALFAVE